jgi:predicted transcriptional regulator
MRYLSEYQTFQSVGELNEALYRHTCDHYFAMNETDRSILKLIGSYAVKYLGAAHLKAATIAEAIGKSEKTARRSLSKLQTLGIIAKVSTMRKVTGGYGANVYVINNVQSPVSSRQQAEKPTEATHEPAKKEAEAITLSSEKELLSSYNTYEQPVSPYVRFKRMVSNFVDDRKLTNRLYGIYLAHSSYLRNSFDVNAILDAGVEAVKVTFQATKRKPLRNVAGYYNGVLDRLLDRLVYDDITYSV